VPLPLPVLVPPLLLDWVPPLLPLLPPEAPPLSIAPPLLALEALVPLLVPPLLLDGVPPLLPLLLVLEAPLLPPLALASRGGAAPSLPKYWLIVVLFVVQPPVTAKRAHTAQRVCVYGYPDHGRQIEGYPADARCAFACRLRGAGSGPRSRPGGTALAQWTMNSLFGFAVRTEASASSRNTEAVARNAGRFASGWAIAIWMA
jgi:hypothetical protein